MPTHVSFGVRANEQKLLMETFLFTATQMLFIYRLQGEARLSAAVRLHGINQLRRRIIHYTTE